MDVLVVEDEPPVREVAVAVLRGAGFCVAEAASAEEALELAESDDGGGPPDVVVPDLRLGPGMDGLGLGAEARRRWPGVGVVYATGHPESFDGRLLGPRERYVLKPFTPARGAARRRAPPDADPASGPVAAVSDRLRTPERPPCSELHFAIVGHGRGRRRAHWAVLADVLQAPLPASTQPRKARCNSTERQSAAFPLRRVH